MKGSNPTPPWNPKGQPTISYSTLEGLRYLRVWHWKQYLTQNYCAQDESIAPSYRNISRDLATAHILAVQLLNDIVSGTAEDDSAKGYS